VTVQKVMLHKGTGAGKSATKNRAPVVTAKICVIGIMRPQRSTPSACFAGTLHVYFIPFNYCIPIVSKLDTNRSGAKRTCKLEGIKRFIVHHEIVQQAAIACSTQDVNRVLADEVRARAIVANAKTRAKCARNMDSSFVLRIDGHGRIIVGVRRMVRVLVVSHVVESD